MSRTRNNSGGVRAHADSVVDSVLSSSYAITRPQTGDIDYSRGGRNAGKNGTVNGSFATPMSVAARPALNIRQKISNVFGYILSMFGKEHMARETVEIPRDLYLDGFQLDSVKKQAGGSMSESTCVAEAVQLQRLEESLEGGAKVSAWQISDEPPSAIVQERTIMCFEYIEKEESELVDWIEAANDKLEDEDGSFNFILVFADYSNLNGDEVARLVELFDDAGAMLTDFPAGAQNFHLAVKTYAESLKGRYIGLPQNQVIHATGSVA